MLEIGEIITVAVANIRGERDRRKIRTGEVIAINDRHFTLAYGNYKETFLLADMDRTYKIKREGKLKEAEIVPLPKTLTEQAIEKLPREKMEELIKAGKTNKDIGKEYDIPDHRVDLLVRKYKLVGLRGVAARSQPEPPPAETEQTPPVMMPEPESTPVEEPETDTTEPPVTTGLNWTEVDGVGQFVDKTKATDEEFREAFNPLISETSDIDPGQPTCSEISEAEPEPDREIQNLRMKIKDLEFEAGHVERFYQDAFKKLEAKAAELERYFKDHSHQVQYGLYSSKAVV